MSATETPSHLRENPYALARTQLDRVGETFGVDPNLIRVLGECKKTVEVSVPVAMDDGAVRVFDGFRVVHNMTRGPAKGGIRYHPALTRDSVRGLLRAVERGRDAAVIPASDGGYCAIALSAV